MKKRSTSKPNLFSNAIRHNIQSGNITITLDVDKLTIANYRAGYNYMNNLHTFTISFRQVA